MIERAKREIELAKQSAIKDLYATSSDLATEIASRILQRELNAQDHEKLIADSIRELGDLEKN
jgi:F-type H+-transporting ATPase subunit b